MKLKPESIKYIIIAVVLFTILLVVVLSFGKPIKLEDESVDKTVVEIQGEAEDENFVVGLDSVDENTIYLFDPDISDKDIEKIEETELNTSLEDSSVIIPGVAVGRFDPNNEQEKLEQFYVDKFNDNNENPVYQD